MAHANRAYLVRRKARWVQIPEGATQAPGATQVPGNPTAPPEKENRPEGRLEKWRPCWGQRWAAMYLSEPATRRFRAPTKKDGMPVPSSELGSALWLGARQPATHRVLGRIMNPRRCPANAVTK